MFPCFPSTREAAGTWTSGFVMALDYLLIGGLIGPNGTTGVGDNTLLRRGEEDVGDIPAIQWI